MALGALGKGLAAAGVAATADFLGSSVVAPLAEGAYNAFSGVPLERQRQAWLVDNVQRNYQQMEANRIQADIRRNMALLAKVDPAKYQELSFGRSLPKGATVIGGRPRQDLLEELAARMASGNMAVPAGMQQSQPPSVDLFGV